MNENVPLVIQLPGEWDLARREELQANLRPAYDCPLVVVDLSKTEYLDSTVLGALIKLHSSRVEERGLEPCHIVANSTTSLDYFASSGFITYFQPMPACRTPSATFLNRTSSRKHCKATSTL